MLLDPSHLSGDAAKVPELMTILAQRKEWAQKSGLSAALIEKIFNAIHEESLYFQR